MHRVAIIKTARVWNSITKKNGSKKYNKIWCAYYYKHEISFYASEVK